MPARRGMTSRRPSSWPQSAVGTRARQGMWASPGPITAMRRWRVPAVPLRWWTAAVTETSAGAGAPARISAIRWPLLLVLASLAALAPVATDLYLPGFPEIGADFGAEASAVQLTLTSFLVGPGLRSAGDGSAVGPSRTTRPADRQRVGLRGRRRRLRAGPDAARAGPRPARAGVRRRRGHGHRAGDHRRRGDRPCGGQGVHADDHGRWRRAGAGAPGGRPARRSHRLARDALDRRRAVRGDAGRRPARDPRDASRRGTATGRRVRAGRRPDRPAHAGVPRAAGGVRAQLRRDDGLHLVLAVRLPERRRASTRSATASRSA